MSPLPSAPQLCLGDFLSKSGYQATTFKYLPSRLQTAKASGDQRCKEQTIQMPLPFPFGNISEFTNDPYLLLSPSTPPPTCHHPCADCNLAWCDCTLSTTTAKAHAAASWCRPAVKMRQQRLGQMGQFACRPTTSKGQRQGCAGLYRFDPRSRAFQTELRLYAYRYTSQRKSPKSHSTPSGHINFI